jgi:hypothetical protein
MPPASPEGRRARGPAKGPVRKQTYEKPRGPIKQRPVSRLYDDDEDLEASVEFDDPAASRNEYDAPDAERDDRTDDEE